MKIELNGMNYFVEQSGSGFPLLMFHGFTGSTTTWYPFLPQLSKSSKVLLVDLLGHGQTDSPEDVKKYDILRVAEDIKVLLDKNEIEKTDILGYSMGGRLAMTFAATYPEKVRKLVLESTSPGLKTEKEREKRRDSDAALAKRILSEGMEAFVNHWERIPLFQTQTNLPLKTREAVRKQRLKNNARGLANSLLGMGTGSQPSWWKFLPDFQFETLILTGELDTKYCQIGQEMVKFLPKAEIIQIQGAGHAIHVEEPEKFGTIVSGFLSK